MGAAFPVRGLHSTEGEEPLVMWDLDVNSCPAEKCVPGDAKTVSSWKEPAHSPEGPILLAVCEPHRTSQL